MEEPLFSNVDALWNALRKILEDFKDETYLLVDAFVTHRLIESICVAETSEHRGGLRLEEL